MHRCLHAFHFCLTFSHHKSISYPASTDINEGSITRSSRPHSQFPLPLPTNPTHTMFKTDFLTVIVPFTSNIRIFSLGSDWVSLHSIGDKGTESWGKTLLFPAEILEGKIVIFISPFTFASKWNIVVCHFRKTNKISGTRDN